MLSLLLEAIAFILHTLLGSLLLELLRTTVLLA
jgi:hypothetical protein